MAATGDVIYETMVSIEASWTPRDYAELKVQRKLIVCAKCHINFMNGVESRGG